MLYVQMKKFILLPLLIAVNFSFAQTLETFHDFIAVKINGDTMNLSDLAGKKVLVVNTASYCSYTPQYTDLQQLYSLYGGSTFEILGFPCNDFGSQEPGNDSSIISFCNSYGVTFQMMHKIDIISPDTAEVYKWLQLQSRNGVANAPVGWNFYKFLIDEAGHWVNYFPSATDPLDTAIVNWVLSPNTTAINQHSGNNSVSILSNLVKDFINIKVEADKEVNLNIKLFSINGSLLADIFKGFINESQQLAYPVNTFADGLYFLKINSGTETKTFKLAILK